MQFPNISTPINAKLACRFHSTTPSGNGHVLVNAKAHQDILSKKPSAQVDIPIDGTGHSFSAILLRDACSCPQCVHKTSRQRLFSTTDVPANIEAEAVELDTSRDFIACLDKINWGPPFLAPFSADQIHSTTDQSQLPLLSVLNSKADRWHDAASKFNALLQRSRYLYERKMKPGECVLFDNTRTLHSRRSFDMEDAGKPRWLRGIYVDKDSYFSKLRVLQNKFGK